MRREQQMQNEKTMFHMDTDLHASFRKSALCSLFTCNTSLTVASSLSFRIVSLRISTLHHSTELWSVDVAPNNSVLKQGLRVDLYVILCFHPALS